MSQPHAAPFKDSWSNWAGNVSARPRQFLQPRREEEVAQIVQRAAQEGQRIRVVGAGHSFTPVAASDDIMLSLDYLSGLESVDRQTGLVSLKAGTRLYNLNQLLHSVGRAQENMGDINRQSVAGAVSTSTHGTGLGLGAVHTQIEALRLIDGLGNTHHLDASTPDLLAAARVSLGALGVVTGVTLRTVPKYHLRMNIRRATLTEMLRDGLEYARTNRHFEFFWIPQTDAVQAKTLNITDDAATKPGAAQFLNDTVLENGALWLVSEVNKAVPALTGRICSLMGAVIGNNTRVGVSHEIFGSNRWVRFTEMEYALPVEALSDALKDLRDLINRRRFPISFPVEVRYGRGDDAMLSTAHGRDTGYIAVHAYKGVYEREYFREAEAIFRAYQGRPHWGKWHHLSAADFAGLYPRFWDFQRIRDQFDPQRRFGSPHLQSVLGE